MAPSVRNTHPWHFIIVESDETKKKLAALDHNKQWMLTAPLFIVCVADSRSRIPEDQVAILDEHSPEAELKQIIRDTAIAIEHILLEAEHLGLATS